MIEQKNTLHKYAMQYGTVMGVYWIFKFILFMLGPSYPFFFLAFSILTLIVPFLGYYYAYSYRNKQCGGAISFSQAWVFTLFMFVYASLLTSVAHFVYFEYIGTDSLMAFYTEQVINPFLTSGNAEQIELGKQLNTMIETFKEAELPPIKFTIEFLSQNIFYGSILALLIALVVKKQPVQETRPFENDDTTLNQ